MAKLTIICDVDTYRLAVNGEESDDVEYGDPAFLTAGRKSYMALVCEDDNGDRFSLLEGDDVWAVEIKGGVEVEFEDGAQGEVDVGDEDTAGDGDGDGDGDGEPDDDASPDDD